MPPDRRQLVIELDTAGVVRAQVGPIGWLVLEAIAAHAPPCRTVVEVRCSSRSLAAIVGVSKDSVARAFRALTDAGIVERVDHREERSGRFSSTTYRVDLASAGITVVAVSQSTAPVAVVTDPGPPSPALLATSSASSAEADPARRQLGYPVPSSASSPSVPSPLQTSREQPRTCIPMPGPSRARVAPSVYGVVRHGRD